MNEQNVQAVRVKMAGLAAGLGAAGNHHAYAGCADAALLPIFLAQTPPPLRHRGLHATGGGALSCTAGPQPAPPPP